MRAALHASCSDITMDFSQPKQLALAVALLTLVGCASAPKSPIVPDQSSLDMASLIGSAAQGEIVTLPANNSLGMDSVIVDRTYFAASGRECRRLLDSNGAPIQRVACKGSDGQWRFARDLSVRTSLPQLSQPGNVIPETAAAQPLIPGAGSTLLLNRDGTLSESVAITDSAELVVIEQDAMTTDIFGNELSVSDYSDTAVAGNETFAVDVNPSLAGDNMVQRELIANETLWSFAKRTTGNALNWKTIAEINDITDAKTLAPGAQLNIPVALVGEGG